MQAQKRATEVGKPFTVEELTEFLQGTLPQQDDGQKIKGDSVSKLKDKITKKIGERIGECIEHKTYTGRASVFQTQKKIAPAIRVLMGLDYDPSDAQVLDYIQEWFLALGIMNDERLTVMVYGELSEEERKEKAGHFRVGLAVKLFEAMSKEERQEAIIRLFQQYQTENNQVSESGAMEIG